MKTEKNKTVNETVTKENFFSNFNTLVNDIKSINLVLNEALYDLTEVDGAKIKEFKEVFNISSNVNKKDTYEMMISEFNKEFNNYVSNANLGKSDLIKGFTRMIETVSENSSYIVDFLFTVRDTIADRLDFLKTIASIYAVDKKTGIYKVRTLGNILSDINEPIFTLNYLKNLRVEKLSDGSYKHDLKDITKTIKDKKSEVSKAINAHYEAIQKAKEAKLKALEELEAKQQKEGN